jgi:hypothetical protein
MKLFEITPSAEIVEPEITGDEVVFAYLGTKYAALLVGDEMPDGTTGLVELDMADANLRAAVVADLLAVGSEASFTPEQRRVYDLLTAPSLAEARAGALDAVKLRHADMLRLLSGDATVEERDTWPNQKDWVGAIRDCGRMLRLIGVITAALPDTADDMRPLVDELNAELAASVQKLEGLLTEAEIAQIEGAGGAPSDVMVQKITQKVAAMDLLIQKATRVRRTATAGLTDAASVADVGAIIAQAEQDAETAKDQYLAAIGAA